MNARFYQPATGRFLSQDTYSGNAYEPWTQHLYSYVGNNPINMVDPTGHFVIPLIMVGVAALLGYFGVATVATQQAGVVSSHNVTLPKINSPAENLLTIAVLATTLVLPFIHSDSKAQEKEKDVATTKTEDKKPKIVYRALNEKDRKTVDAGTGIDRFGSDSLMSLEQHVAFGSKKFIRDNSPWISATTSVVKVKYFDSGNGIVAIDLNKVGYYEYAYLYPFASGSKAYNYSRQQMEVSIFEYVPPNAIMGKWDTYPDFEKAFKR